MRVVQVTGSNPVLVIIFLLQHDGAGKPKHQKAALNAEAPLLLVALAPPDADDKAHYDGKDGEHQHGNE